MDAGWKPIAHAVAELAEKGVGREALLRRLGSGMVPARAHRLAIAATQATSRGAPRFRPVEENVSLPLWFWRCCEWSPDYPPTLDWKTGDFHGQTCVQGRWLLATAYGVTVDIAAVRAMLPAPPTAKAQGRPRSSGSKAASDAPLIQRMRALVEAGGGDVSATAAAQQVVDEAQGGGTEESKVRRLQRGYAKLYG